MTCKDCIHWRACKNAARDYAGEGAAYDDDGYCEVFAETCEDFSDKSEWVHLIGKDCKTAYYAVEAGNDAQVIKEPICGYGIKDGKQCVVDEYGDFYEIGNIVFLTEEEAQKEVERRKKING